MVLALVSQVSLAQIIHPSYLSLVGCDLSHHFLSKSLKGRNSIAQGIALAHSPSLSEI